MKKLLYSVLAVLVMSVAFVSCKDSKAPADKDSVEATESEKAEETKEAAVDANANPADKLVGMMGDMVQLLKDTHIKSADDLMALKDKLENFKTSFEETSLAMASMFSNITEENATEIAASMQELEKRIEVLEQEGEAESERLEAEAKALGLDLDALDDIF